MEYEEGMALVIEETRRIFGDPPRKLRWADRRRARMPVPRWVRQVRDQRFDEIFKNQDVLIQKGRIVWGAIVQANELLFERGREDHPAAIMYSLEPQMDSAVEVLENACHRLFSVKGTMTGDPELQEFADKLADEYVSDLRLPVPLPLTDGIPCHYSCIMVHRKHLPDRKLSMGVFPILANPFATDAVMILSCRYWPEILVDLWTSAGDA